jgi:hypothetical protein
LDAPELAAHQKTALVQVLGNFFHAYARAFFAVDIKGKDFADNLGLGGVNIKFLLVPPVCPRLSRVNRAVAKGCSRALK